MARSFKLHPAVAVVVVVACAMATYFILRDGPKAPRRTDTFEAHFVLYVLGATDDLDARVLDLAQSRLDQLPGARTGVNSTAGFSVVVVPIHDLPPPDADALRYYSHMNGPDAARLANARAAIRFDVTGPRVQAGSLLLASTKTVYELARQTDSIIWDNETREAFNLDAFLERRIDGFFGDDPIVPRHVVIHAYRDGDRVRSITLGMGRFGLPDLVLEGYRPESGPAVGLLLGMVAQSMFERRSEANVTSVEVNVAASENPRFRTMIMGYVKATDIPPFTVPLVDVPREDGDPDNRIVSLGLTLAERDDVLASLALKPPTALLAP